MRTRIRGKYWIPLNDSRSKLHPKNAIVRSVSLIFDYPYSMYLEDKCIDYLPGCKSIYISLWLTGATLTWAIAQGNQPLQNHLQKEYTEIIFR
jgi:hypothetical protein